MLTTLTGPKTLCTGRYRPIARSWSILLNMILVCSGCSKPNPAEPQATAMIPRVGNRIIFTAKYADGTSGIDWCEADGSRRQTLLKSDWRVTAQPYAGRMIADKPTTDVVLGGPDSLCIFDLSRREPISVDAELVDMFTSISLSPDGTQVLKRLGLGYLSIVSVDGYAVRNLADRVDYLTRPVISPDGSEVAYLGVDWSTPPKNHPSIHIVSTRGLGDRDLGDTVDRVAGVDLAWSPDGQRLAYADLHLQNRVDLITINIDGGGRQNLSNGVDSDFHPQWSPDGSRIAFTTGDPDGARDIVVINADGTGRRNLTTTADQNEDFVQWSPDGSKLLFLSVGSAVSLNVIDLATGIIVTVAESVEGPAYWDYSIE